MPVVRIFDRLEAAENARVALIAAGFEAPRVELTARADEAGAVQGNFLVGNAKTGEAADASYAANFANVAFGEIFLLAVATDDEASASRALAVMDGFGGRDVDAGMHAPGAQQGLG